MGRAFDKPRRMSGGKVLRLVGWWVQPASTYPQTIAAVDVEMRSGRRRMYFSNHGPAGSDRFITTPEHEIAHGMAVAAWSTGRSGPDVPGLRPGSLAVTWTAAERDIKSEQDLWVPGNSSCWRFDKARHVVTVVGAASPWDGFVRGGVRGFSRGSEAFPFEWVLDSEGRVRMVTVNALDVVSEPT